MIGSVSDDFSLAHPKLVMCRTVNEVHAHINIILRASIFERAKELLSNSQW